MGIVLHQETLSKYAGLKNTGTKPPGFRLPEVWSRMTKAICAKLSSLSLLMVHLLPWRLLKHKQIQDSICLFRGGLESEGKVLGDKAKAAQQTKSEYALYTKNKAGCVQIVQVECFWRNSQGKDASCCRDDTPWFDSWETHLRILLHGFLTESYVWEGDMVLGTEFRKMS